MLLEVSFTVLVTKLAGFTNRLYEQTKMKVPSVDNYKVLFFFQ